MSERPLAYHFTFSTYGTHLHGDKRGSIDRTTNHPGQPIVDPDPMWQAFERRRMRSKTVYLSVRQRTLLEHAVPMICTRGNWQYHICSAAADHMHVLLTTTPEQKPESVRSLLKRWLGQVLDEHWIRQIASWWTEGGSIRSVCSIQYFEACFQYIERQRTTAFEPCRLETPNRLGPI